jgi:hypothetical protein
MIQPERTPADQLATDHSRARVAPAQLIELFDREGRPIHVLARRKQAPVVARFGNPPMFRLLNEMMTDLFHPSA